jgi:large subunit ribosomal protein L10
MALTRASKSEKVKKLAVELEHSTSAIIGTFKGLTASKDFELRKIIRKAGGSYHVVKNKLAERAAEGSNVEAALKGLKGVSAVAYTSGDPVALAKALSEWVKENAEFTFKLGIVDGKVINISEIEQLAKMPGKEELFSKLLFLISSPAQRLATVINATGRNLAVVVNQGIEKGKFAAASAPAAAAPAPVDAAPAVAEVKAEAPTIETGTQAAVTEAAAHVEEAAAGEQPSGAAQPENSTASQGGEAATTDPVEG